MFRHWDQSLKVILPALRWDCVLLLIYHLFNKLKFPFYYTLLVLWIFFYPNFVYNDHVVYMYFFPLHLLIAVYWIVAWKMFDVKVFSVEWAILIICYQYSIQVQVNLQEMTNCVIWKVLNSMRFICGKPWKQKANQYGFSSSLVSPADLYSNLIHSIGTRTQKWDGILIRATHCHAHHPSCLLPWNTFFTNWMPIQVCSTFCCGCIPALLCFFVFFLGV